MHKKLIMACMALVAFAALALPAMASAANDPQLTENGSLVKPGELIVGTNIGETLFTDTSNNTLVRCTTDVMTGTLTRNDSGFVEGTITRADFSGTGTVSSHNSLNECTGSFGNAYITVGLPLCIRSTPTMKEDEFQVGSDPGSCTSFGNAKFIIGSTTAGACEYESTTPVKGTFTTSPKEAELTVEPKQETSGSKLIKGGFLCPSSGMLNMKFNLETENGTGLTIS